MTEDSCKTFEPLGMLEPSLADPESVYGNNARLGDGQAWPNAEVKSNENGQLCRVCANGGDYFIPIFDGQGLEHKLEEKICKHLPIKVTASDALPLELCYQCASTIIAWDTLLRNCLEADKKLKQILEDSNKADELKMEEVEIDADDHPTFDNDVTDSDDEPLITSRNKIRASLAEKPPKKRGRKPSVRGEKVSEEVPKEDDSERDSFGSAVKEESDDEMGNNSSKCEACNMEEPNFRAMQQHLRDAHPDATMECKLCSRWILKMNFPNHVKQAHGFDLLGERPRRDGVQSFCKVELGESDLQRPIIEFPSFDCTFCKQSYSSELNLKKHMYNVHRMARVRCEVCDKEVNKKSLDRHMKKVHSARVSSPRQRRIVPDEQKIPCYLCPKKCASLMSLHAHIKNIHEAEQFKCTQCDFSSSKKGLERHFKKEHNVQVFQCTFCSKVLKSKSTLKEHMWIHTDHRRFICDVCGMRFKRTSNYHGHMKSHQEKKFQCQLCGNFFLRKRYLAVHEQTIHNFYGKGVAPQEKGFQCEVCGVKLKWKNNLMAHMRIHTGEKPYKCKICGDNFTCHGSLRTHMSKHAVNTAPCPESTVVIQSGYLMPSMH